MEVIKVKISDLVFDPNNARKHNPKNIDAIKGSLTKFGQQKPIVIDSKNIVIAGNGTLSAAKELGWKEIAAVVTTLDDFNKMAFALADNRTSELAEWDIGNLNQQLAQLDLGDFDLKGIGFEDGDFSLDDEKKGNEGLTDPDDVPEVPQNVFGVKRGDVWILGNHRLMCGDSTSEDDVKKLMDGKKADMVFTDPPYNLTGGGTNQVWNKNGTGLGEDQYIDAGKGKLFNVPEFCEWIPSLKSLLVNDSIMFVMSNVRNLKPIMTELEKTGAKIHNILVMDKNAGFPHIWYTCHSEFILYYYYGKAIHPVNKCKPNIFQVKMPRGEEKKHTSQKPISMIEEIIKDHSVENILEPFCGSGSTLIACEKTGRICYGMELDEHYCSVIIKRWEDFTGLKAERLSNA